MKNRWETIFEMVSCWGSTCDEHNNIDGSQIIKEPACVLHGHNFYEVLEDDN